MPKNEGRARWRTYALLFSVLMLAGGASWGTSAGAEAPPKRHVVEMRGFKFLPATVKAAVGDTIVWVNRDIAPHTATAKGSGWDTGSVAAGAQMKTVVSGKGAQAYLCVFHPTMKGVLVVD